MKRLFIKGVVSTVISISLLMTFIIQLQNPRESRFVNTSCTTVELDNGGVAVLCGFETRTTFLTLFEVSLLILSILAASYPFLLFIKHLSKNQTRLKKENFAKYKIKTKTITESTRIAKLRSSLASFTIRYR